MDDLRATEIAPARHGDLAGFDRAMFPDPLPALFVEAGPSFQRDRLCNTPAVFEVSIRCVNDDTDFFLRDVPMSNQD